MTQTIAHPANADVASALAEARADFVKRNPKSQKLHEDACASLPGGNTPIAFAKDIRDEYAEAGRLLKRTKGKL
mgnify:CR=1 FL=1